MERFSRARTWLWIKKVLKWLLVIVIIVFIALLLRAAYVKYNAKKNSATTTTNTKKTRFTPKTSADSTRDFQKTIRILKDSVAIKNSLIAALRPATQRLDHYRLQNDSLQRQNDTLRSRLASSASQPVVGQGAPVLPPTQTVAVIQPGNPVVEIELQKLKKRVTKVETVVFPSYPQKARHKKTKNAVCDCLSGM